MDYEVVPQVVFRCVVMIFGGVITRPMAPIIEDWVSDTEDESEPNDPQNVLSFVQASEHVKPSGHFVQPVEAPILAATLKPTSSKATRSGKRKNIKTCFVCRGVDHLIKDCTGPTWLFDIDSLTKTMNYQSVTAGNQTNPSAGFQDTFDADKAGNEANLQYVLFPMWSTVSSNPQNKGGDTAFAEKEHDAETPYSNPISDAGPSNSNSSPTHGKSLLRDTYQPLDMVEREDIDYSDHKNVGAEVDFDNPET
uniref:Uncharacterized protein n=1 Tax=Tanacetum cinerariifolium TaxID=118510 RepID=A0A6L2KV77_TANCI|nr:hypothetical protein [Tanacetum cinerariifolium]